MLTRLLQRFETCLTNKIRTVTLNENQFGTLVSWAYNVGCGAMEGSTLVKRLLKGDDPNTVAQEELPTWRTSLGEVHPGLVARRKKEIALFQTDSSTMALPLSC
jgi:GH24 family phage-related lysozyme (muramidase)